MPYESNSAASDVSLAWYGLRIIQAMQPSAARSTRQLCAWQSATRTRARLTPGMSPEHTCDVGSAQSESTRPGRCRRTVASRALRSRA